LRHCSCLASANLNEQASPPITVREITRVHVQPTLVEEMLRSPSYRPARGASPTHDSVPDDDGLRPWNGPAKFPEWPRARRRRSPRRSADAGETLLARALVTPSRRSSRAPPRPLSGQDVPGGKNMRHSRYLAVKMGTQRKSPKRTSDPEAVPREPDPAADRTAHVPHHGAAPAPLSRGGRDRPARGGNGLIHGPIPPPPPPTNRPRCG
jgi:hypothetical protein